MLFTAELPDAIMARALELAHAEALPAWTRTVQVFPCATEALADIEGAEHRYYYPLRGGKWIITELESGARFALNDRALAKGARVLSVSYPSALIPLLGHERPVSSLDGDILIQCALFGTWKHRPEHRAHERTTIRP